MANQAASGDGEEHAAPERLRPRFVRRLSAALNYCFGSTSTIDMIGADLPFADRSDLN